MGTQYILGVSGLYHDSAAALVKDGSIVAAAQEERFTRVKMDASLPKNAIKYCMESAGIGADMLDAVVYYDNPVLTCNRFMKNIENVSNDVDDLLDLYLEPMLLKKIWVRKDLEKIIGGLGRQNKLFVTRHHHAHAASAFYPSPYENAVIITLDGVGEWATTAIGVGKGNKIHIYEEIQYPHSIGLLYSAFTYYCGFKVNFGDYKLMGLAPYGDPVYYGTIQDHLIDIKEDGSFRLNMDYFDFQYGRAMVNDKFCSLFEGDRRKPESVITKREMDLAASVQKVVNEAIVSIARYAKNRYGTGVDNLVMAGGVALNCVANGLLRKKKIFDNIWIQPAAGDSGGALGAALYYFYHHSNGIRNCDEKRDAQQGSYLGPEYDNAYIESFLEEQKCVYKKYEDEELFDKIAEFIDEQQVIGLFHGKMEYGPRALGNRSIIADARSEKMQSRLNLKIKYRESFRPFAPAVLLEDLNDYFDCDIPSPYMLFCDDVKVEKRLYFDKEKEMEKSNNDLRTVVCEKRSDIPAVTHVDYSARIQTVSEEDNPYYYRLIKAFKRTGCGVIINTSFNVRGEPIVCTPLDAWKCFWNTEMDILVMENLVIVKDEQSISPDIFEGHSFELD